MAAESIISSIREFLRSVERNGIPVSFGVLFGSQARGTADKYSDVDVVVISPRFDEVRRREDLNLLWQLAAQVKSRIEPIPCGERQWIEDDGSPIIEIARREGQKVTP